MTRKKFIKHMMAHGYSRNESNRIAKDIINGCKSYEVCFKHLIFASWLSGEILGGN
jgi:hypothetical protein